jgi:hypothetical protein
MEIYNGDLAKIDRIKIFHSKQTNTFKFIITVEGINYWDKDISVYPELVAYEVDSLDQAEYYKTCIDDMILATKIGIEKKENNT